MRWSDFHYDDWAFGIASYSKPATLLVALRAVLGEETFMHAYRTFIRDWAYKHPYPYDFFNTFETVSRQDLDWFWDSWYFKTWTLDQAIVRVHQQNDQAEIVIEDRGRVPMPVFLTVSFENGTSQNVELPVTMWLQGKTEVSLTIAAPSPVTSVEIDPEFYFPDIDRSNNIWTREQDD